VALTEAMACALPVVGTTTGGVRELVTHGVDGLLVPPRDAPSLGTALESLARNPERAATLSMAARARVERDFDTSRAVWTLMREIGVHPSEEVGHELSALPVGA
jgi:glycosyltransferase involved in cell wall biosynthesis